MVVCWDAVEDVDGIIIVVPVSRMREMLRIHRHRIMDHLIAVEVDAVIEEVDVVIEVDAEEEEGVVGAVTIEACFLHVVWVVSQLPDVGVVVENVIVKDEGVAVEDEKEEEEEDI